MCVVQPLIAQENELQGTTPIETNQWATISKEQIGA